MDIPRIGGVDGRRGGCPIPPIEQVDEGMPLGQSGFSGLMTHQASQFTAVGKPPVGKAEYIVPVHGCHVIESFLPCQRKLSDIGVFRPDESRQPILNPMVKHRKTFCRPGHAVSERTVLSASGAIDVAPICIVAGNLPCLKTTTHYFGLSILMVRNPCLAAPICRPLCFYFLLGIM
ncbi:conserved hypothetical protein [delta proteobacterium NaphS2]|nr:conserved hypothetical protein [delta proteobacterium NaphS2]